MPVCTTRRAIHLPFARGQYFFAAMQAVSINRQTRLFVLPAFDTAIDRWSTYASSPYKFFFARSTMRYTIRFSHNVAHLYWMVRARNVLTHDVGLIVFDPLFTSSPTLPSPRPLSCVRGSHGTASTDCYRHSIRLAPTGCGGQSHGRCVQGRSTGKQSHHA